MMLLRGSDPMWVGDPGGIPLTVTSDGRFLSSIVGLLGLPLQVPDYSTLCRRAGDVAILLGRRASDEPRHIVLDSTVLKVYGEGE